MPSSNSKSITWVLGGRYQSSLVPSPSFFSGKEGTGDEAIVPEELPMGKGHLHLSHCYMHNYNIHDSCSAVEVYILCPYAELSM